MQIYNTLISFASEAIGQIFTCETIYYEEKYWLVLKWLYSPDKTHKKPERIVCLSDMQFQKTDWPGKDFVLNVPIPKVVFDIQIPPSSLPGYIVIDYPEVIFPIPRA